MGLPKYQGYKWREAWRGGMATPHALRAMAKPWHSLRRDQGGKNIFIDLSFMS